MRGWHNALPLELHGCCDCGLVHSVRWRLVGGNLQWRWERNPAATRAVRKRKMHKGRR